MTGTTPQGRENAVRPSPAERTHLIRTLAVAVVAQLAVLAALAGCGLTIRGGSAAPITRLPGAYPTYAPGPTPRPVRPNQAALVDAVSNSGPLFEQVFWIPKYPEPERRDALPGWLHKYNNQWPDSGGKPAMGRLTHFPAQ
jgi:hypothetical protein